MHSLYKLTKSVHWPCYCTVHVYVAIHWPCYCTVHVYVAIHWPCYCTVHEYVAIHWPCYCTVHVYVPFIDPAIVLSMCMLPFIDPAIILSMCMLPFIFAIVCDLIGWKRIWSGFLSFVYICILQLEIQLSKGKVWDILKWINPPHCCPCPKPGHGYPVSYS